MSKRQDNSFSYTYPKRAHFNQNDCDFPKSKADSRYYKYFAHLTWEVIEDKNNQLPSFWRNCLILFMMSSGVPRKEISELMGISLSRINQITLNTKKQLLSEEKISPVTEIKETKWYVKEIYLKSPKFKYSAMELCRDTSEHVLDKICGQTPLITTVIAGYKLANMYWDKLHEKGNEGHYLIP